MKKIEYVRKFYEDQRGAGTVQAITLYRIYAAVVPKRMKVQQGTFVRWAPQWVEHHKERRRINPGEWDTISIINLGEYNGL